MDFLYSTDRGLTDTFRRILRPAARRYPHRTCLEFSGDWGCVVTTDTRYAGMRPVQSARGLTLVLGDPLLPGLAPAPGAPAPSARAQAVDAAWAAAPDTLEPHHPATLIHVPADGGAVRILTDAWGSIPIYRHGGSTLVLGSSPDLVAQVAPCTFDRLSALERLAAFRITYPHTLYQEIKQLPPASRISVAGPRAKKPGWFGGATRASGPPSVSATRWWTPPLPETGTDPALWHTRIAELTRDTLARIEAQVTDRPGLTISAGYDSRFLASQIKRESGLRPTAHNIAAHDNIVRWTAQQVAKTLGLPFHSATRRVDHYAAIQLDGYPEIGTNVCILDAHFAEQALGPLNGVSALIGGVMADTVVAIAAFYHRRTRAIAAGRLGKAAPVWVVDPIYDRLSAQDRAAMDARQAEAQAALGLTDAHEPIFCINYPITCQPTHGHFDAARRSYPIYEPFMTTPMVHLGFALPVALRDQGASKAPLYGSYLDDTADIPLNPQNTPAFAGLVADLKAVLPQALWPAELIGGAEWFEVKGPLVKALQAELVVARTKLSEVLSLDITELKGPRPKAMTLTTFQAYERCVPPSAP